MIKTSSWVTRRPHPDGWQGCIRDTNIRIWGLVEWRRLGQSDEEILGSIKGLTPDDLEAAWEYARQHPEEIDSAIERNASA